MCNAYNIVNKVEVKTRGRITRGGLPGRAFLNKNLISIGGKGRVNAAEIILILVTLMLG